MVDIWLRYIINYNKLLTYKIITIMKAIQDIYNYHTISKLTNLHVKRGHFKILRDISKVIHGKEINQISWYINLNRLYICMLFQIHKILEMKSFDQIKKKIKSLPNDVFVVSFYFHFYWV